MLILIKLKFLLTWSLNNSLSIFILIHYVYFLAIHVTWWVKNIGVGIREILGEIVFNFWRFVFVREIFSTGVNFGEDIRPETLLPLLDASPPRWRLQPIIDTILLFHWRNAPHFIGPPTILLGLFKLIINYILKVFLSNISFCLVTSWKPDRFEILAIYTFFAGNHLFLILFWLKIQ